MIRIYGAVLDVIALALIINAIYFFAISYRKRNKLYTSIIQLFVFGALGCAAYAAAITARDMKMAEYFYALYFCCIDWILITFIFFSRYYTKMWNDGSIAPYLQGVIAFIDGVSLLTNYKYHHAFKLVYHTISADEGCYLKQINDYFIVHLVYCYILVAIILIMYVTKIAKTGGFDRGKYITVFLVFLLIIGGNAAYMTQHYALDISITLYAIAALFIAYYAKSVNSKAFIEYLLSNIAEKMDCALFAYDESDECIYYNQLASAIFGMKDTTVVLNEYFRKWKDGRNINEIEDRNWNDSFDVNGEECRFDVHFTKIYDKKGHYSGSFFSMYDVTSDYVAYEEEKYRSSHDTLTGALNRDSFYLEAKNILDAYPTTDYVIVCSDIKGFKLINDMFGLDTADKILIKIADVIRSKMQAGSSFARLEADRFAVLMPKERYSEELFMTGIRTIEYILNSSQYKMNILIGVYDVYDRETSVASMCDRAFLAIESIKGSYNTQIAYYGDMLRNEYMNEQKIIGEFENALAEGQFAMFLQPIVERDGAVNFAEALVRWVHPTKGIISPAGFIPILENTGFIYKLDTYIWEQACKRLAFWTANGHDEMSISINISVKDFYYIDIYETLVDLVEKYHINAAKLKLEITESVFMTETERQLDIIYALKDYGFIIEIDDFGSGYSSLNMLKDVPANVLKLDMVFLSTTAHEEKGKKIIDTIVTLAKALDMKVVVEGVETEEQLNFLKDTQCDLFQGYYFDKPIMVKTFEDKYLNKEEN